MSPKFVGYIIKIYNRVIRWKILNSDFRFFEKFRNFMVYLVCNSKELRASFGKENPDITFYVIRDPSRMAGLFAVHHYVVKHIKDAVERGMIPIIDTKHYPNLYYMDRETIGRVNWWEYCFKQPYPYTLEDVYRSKNVILCSGNYDRQLSEIFDPDAIMKSHDIIIKYMQLSPEAKEICEKEWKHIKGDAQRILGVKCRGTDYTSLKLHGHGIVPSTQMTIDKIEELLYQWGEKAGQPYDCIFVATEDEEILSALRKHFGDLVVYNKSDRFRNVGNQGLFDINKKKNFQYKYRQLMDYLVATYCLAQCDGLIAPRVNGTLGAMRMKGKYDDVYIFHLGNYD